MIDDNVDLSLFLAIKLCSRYEVFVAENGNLALQLAFDYVPDIIVSDIVLPRKEDIPITNT